MLPGAALLLMLGVPASVLPAARSATAPVLDGRLDDPEWTGAPSTDHFTQKQPADGSLPSERTLVRVLYDDRAIYVGIDCEQVRSPIVARLTRRDREPDADFVSISLGTRQDGQSAFRFDVNAAGVLTDGLHFDDTNYTRAWDGNWDARTSRTPRGWAAEMMIPLRVLRFQDEPAQHWQFNVRRYIAQRQEMNEWAYVPRTESGVVSRFGSLQNVSGLAQSRSSFELMPFVVGRVGRQDRTVGLDGLAPFSGPGGGTRGYDRGASRLSLAGLVGLDLRWLPSPDLVLDATFNPDFGQVEADEVVLNLTTIETYHPEKRPFFQEGLDLFQTQRTVVHTRRIGRLPALPGLPPGETQLEPIGPAVIPAALKLVGRPVATLHVGLLSAVTSPNETLASAPDGQRRLRLADPWTVYNVLRLKQVSGDASVGLLGTAVNRFEQPALYPTDDIGVPVCPGQSTPTPGQECFRQAYVGLVDGRWRPAGRDFVVSAEALASVGQGGAPRSFPDGTLIRPGDLGAGWGLDAEKDGGKHLLLWARSEGSSRTLDFNDLGYQRRQNVLRNRGRVIWRTTEPRRGTLDTHSRIDVYDERTLGGLTLANRLALSSHATLWNFWHVQAEVHAWNRSFDDREVGDGTALERGERIGVRAAVSNDVRSPVIVETELQAQRLRSGFAASSNTTITLRATSRWDIDLVGSITHEAGDPRHVGGTTDTTLIFGRLRATGVGTTVRSTYTFTPRLSLQTYAQLFVAAGRHSELSSYTPAPGERRPIVRLSMLVPGAAAPADSPDFQRASLNANLVLRWEYRLGSVLYLVYARSQTPATLLETGERPALKLTPLGAAPSSDTVLVKLSYWFG